jgi:hypothetical protein
MHVHNGATIRLWWTFFFLSTLFSLSFPWQNTKVSRDFFVPNLVLILLIAICFFCWFFHSSYISWFHLISKSNLVFILLIPIFLKNFLIEFCFLFHPSSFFFHFFMSNLVPILFITIYFVWDPFLLYFFFQFHPLLFCWLGILLPCILGVFFYGVSLGFMIKVKGFKG